MHQLENCQTRYRSNTWVGQTRTDGPDEFEPRSATVNENAIIFSHSEALPILQQEPYQL